MVDVTKLSEAALMARIAKAGAVTSRLCDALISAGYGHERASDTRLRAVATGDKLACDWVKARDAEQILWDEESARLRYQGNRKPIKRKA